MARTRSTSRMFDTLSSMYTILWRTGPSASESSSPLSRSYSSTGPGTIGAVDDAGSGYASLRHILRLKPDIIKLDIDLTRAIDLDPARRALAAALVTFADKIGAIIVAEGIETASELDTLRELGVTYGQGYHLARPGPLPLDGRAATARASVPSIARPTP